VKSNKSYYGDTMQKWKLAMLANAALLSACALSPSHDELSHADYGAYPTEFKQVIERYMTHVLKDPESARYEYLNMPMRGWRRTSGGSKFGYVVCVNVNARNSYGGYTGSQPSYFMIHDDRVIYALYGDGGLKDSLIEGACAPFVS
jgi:hypothetical protein